MGSRSFMPAGSVATMAQAATLGRVRRGGVRRKRKSKTSATRRTKKRSARRSSSSSRRKPKPGTKAWMAYIRGKRGKKRK